ncbi:MAG TPA: ABC transporter ATP-binding protein [Gammaproteobacteria bacterium]|nr:ABC transporter ATP-binding protein [Gammaproteobacteria bacterium]
MAPLVEARGVTKHFPLARGQVVHAVDNVSLTIAEREVVGLVGESGSGKSTFGRALVGLHTKTAGEVLFRGVRLPDQYGPKDFRRYATEIQMIFQDPYSSLNPRMTVGEIIGEGLKLNGRGDAAQVRDQVGDWLARVGLERSHASRYPHEFSGGQRQRVGIARALILKPKFIVCDEPISALDVSVQAQIVRLLGELKASLGLTMLFIAHDLSMVRYVSDRMAVMYLGSLVEIGPADEVYFRPKHPYTEILVASNPQADPRTERHRRAISIRGEIASPINVHAGCRFAARCPKVMEVCRSVTPQLRTVADGDTRREVACHLFEPPKSA